MKTLLLLAFASLSIFSAKSQDREEKMRSVVFKAQDFCRVELKDFEFDVHFSVVSAVVYFTGEGFKSPVKTTIKGPDLRPIKEFMNRCVPGSMVIFDEVKVLGPDKEVRTIGGLSLVLR